MCLASGAERNRLPWWRTTRAHDDDAPARRSQRTEPAPRCGRVRSATGCRRRSGRSSCRYGPPSWRPASPRRRSSWALAALGCRAGYGQAECADHRRCVVMGSRPRDAERRRSDLEIVAQFARSASSGDRGSCQKSQSHQPHAPDRGRRFYLAVRGWCLPDVPTPLTCADLSERRTAGDDVQSSARPCIPRDWTNSPSGSGLQCADRQPADRPDARSDSARWRAPLT